MTSKNNPLCIGDWFDLYHVVDKSIDGKYVIAELDGSWRCSIFEAETGKLISGKKFEKLETKLSKVEWMRSKWNICTGYTGQPSISRK